ncbi:hypothetical protein RB600_001180 [Gaeumannomyces tritici]
MYFTAELAGDGFGDVADPKHRNIYFEGPQSTVVNLLRHGWTGRGSSADKMRDLGADKAFWDWAMTSLRNSRACTEKVSPHAKVEGVERGPDKELVDSEWRANLLKLCGLQCGTGLAGYAHLFADIGKAIPEVNCQMGHYHPFNHNSWVVSYPAADCSSSSSSPARGVVRRWDTNVLIPPAFLDKGVAVKATRFVGRDGEPTAAPGEDGAQDGVESVEMGRFVENEDLAWFVKADMDVKFELEVDADVDADADADAEAPQRTGVAAVFAVGPLCLDPHGEEPFCNHAQEMEQLRAETGRWPWHSSGTSSHLCHRTLSPRVKAPTPANPTPSPPHPHKPQRKIKSYKS